MSWLQRNSLWIVSLGLMLASSGLDGAYMAQWMTPPSLAFLGYVLNTVADITGEIVMYWYGMLCQTSPKRSKKYKMAQALLIIEAIVIFYSWFFAWRQLRFIMPAIEQLEWQWVAPLSAAFVPLLLAACGYVQALVTMKFGQELTSSPVIPKVPLPKSPSPGVTPVGNKWQATCPLGCGWVGKLYDTSYQAQSAIRGHSHACPAKVVSGDDF